MKYRITLVLVLAFALLSGCASNKEIAANADRINELQGRSVTIASEIEKMSSLMNEMIIQVSIMNSQIDKLSNINMGDDVVVDDEMRFIEQEISRLANRVNTMETSDIRPGQPLPTMTKKNTMTVKVLTGTGDIRSAKMLAQTLRTSGYYVAVVDYSASDIFQNTVFYAAGHRNEALNLSRLMGKNTIVKPLTWDSIFGLIVVKGQ